MAAIGSYSDGSFLKYLLKIGRADQYVRRKRGSHPQHKGGAPGVGSGKVCQSHMPEGRRRSGEAQTTRSIGMVEKRLQRRQNADSGWVS